MRLSDELKAIIYERLSGIFYEAYSEQDILEVLLFLNRWNNETKIIPYGIFNDDGVIPYGSLKESEYSATFVKWLDSSTHNIEKSFNKARKLSRMIKDISIKRLTRGKSLLVSSYFVALLSSFLLDTHEEVIVNYGFKDIDRSKEILRGIKCFVSVILAIELMDTKEQARDLLEILLLADNKEVFEQLAKKGIK